MATSTYKTAEELQAENSLKVVFNKLDGDRTTILNKARDCSKLTIPSVLPDDSFTEQTSLPDTYNSLGARAVNNLSNKLLLGLLPPSSSFFRLKIIDEDLQQQVEQSGIDSDIEKKLSDIESAIMDKIETSGMRPIVHQAFVHLIVTGNVALLYEDETMHLYKLDSYVVQRDFSGNVIDVVLKEKIGFNALPDDLASKLELTDEERKKDIELYTRYIRQGSNWLTYQEVNDLPVDGSEQTIKDKNMPLMVLRWTKINGENYGRGLVEQMIGDFRSLEGLTQMMIEYSAIAAKVIFGVRPGSPIELDELEEAENGGVIVGNLEQDVTRLSVDKQADLQIPLKLVEDITRRIGAAFLLQSTTVRDSERTTALEIQYLARELEDALGGIYSIISQEFQLPLVKILMADMKYDLGNGVEPSITTGLSALGRTQDLEKIRQLNQLIAEVNPDYVVKYLNVEEYLKRIGTALAIKDVDTLFVSQDQVAQEQQQQTDANVPNVQDPNKIQGGANNG
jgi:hypothetical protein